LYTLPIGTKLEVGKETILEVSQIGKECHAGCAIFKLTGKCIMPKEGIFARVLKGGPVKSGDEIKVYYRPSASPEKESSKGKTEQ
jgi:MOSC domain-containing protein YiiM